MLVRSTGLGKSELVAHVVTIRSQGDYLIMEMQTTEPVKWKIRGAVSFKDLRDLIKALLRFSSVCFFLNLKRWFQQPVHPGEF